MIKLYNTLSRKKEEFKPLEKNKVKMYVCGPTTYNYIHLGNARPLVVFDVIRRYLEYKGYYVLYIQNFTDIDDKIIDKASEEGIDPTQVAEKYIEGYYKDADDLNVRRADQHPRVSRHVNEIIDAVQELVERGFGYAVDGDVYFNVRKYKDYGKLSGRCLEDLKSGARVELDERKKDPLDFALWKAAKPGEPSWESPWGAGRPGWHIECSVMATKYLNNSFDIHGGGIDLIFPHHENELAQAEACSDGCFARYWMHNGFITVNEEKMSKSLGNFFLVREILSKFPADVVRFYLLNTHYRSPLDFDDEKLEVASKSLERIKNNYSLINNALKTEPSDDCDTAAAFKIIEVAEKLIYDFERAMDDDFNTALASAAIFEFCKDINTIVNNLNFKLTEEVLQALRKARDIFDRLAGDVLGIMFLSRENSKISYNSQANNYFNNLVEVLIEIRQEAREKKDWKTADTIRDRLKECDIILEDTSQGTRWKFN